MKCVIPSPNVKIMARAVHSLAKIGDEIFIQPSAEDLILRTINSPKSAFAEFRMCRSFFSYFNFNDPEDIDSRCKVTMKSFISVFKGAHNLDKQVENCELRLKPDTTVVVLQIKFSNGSIKKYYLSIIESDQLEAQIPTGAPNQLAASSKFLSSSLKNFRHSEDEITLAVGREKTVIKNHLELRRDITSMRTELCFHQNEFESYVVGNPTNVTFCLKEFRSIVTFAEPANLPIIITFTQPGRPIVFQVLNHPAYEMNYVVSTLNSTEADTSRISVTRTTVSPQATPNFHEITNQNRINPPPFECPEEKTEVEIRNRKSSMNPLPLENSNENNGSFENNARFDSSNFASSNKRKLLNSCDISLPEPKRRNISSSRTQGDIANPNCHTTNLNITLDMSELGIPNINRDLIHMDLPKVVENGDDFLVIPESEPSDSFQDAVIPGPSRASDDVFKRPTSRQNSESSQPPPELLKTIFSRCFSKDHFLDALVGHDIILEESSDREVV